MKKLLLLLLALIAIGFFSVYAQKPVSSNFFDNNYWEQVGNILRIDNGYAKTPKLMTCNNELYIVYNDYTFSHDKNWIATDYHKIYLKKLEGTQWVDVGEPQEIFSSIRGKNVPEPVNCAFPSVAFDSSSTPYIAAGVVEGQTPKGGTVKKLVDGKWETLVENAFKDQKINEIQSNHLFFLNNQLQLMAFGLTAFKTGPFMNMYQINGSEWKKLGNWHNNRGMYFFTDFVVIDDVAYLAFAENNAGRKAVVYKFSNNRWIKLGNFASDKPLRAISLSENNDKLYIAYTTGGNSFKAYVKEWNGSTWKTIGSENGFNPGSEKNNLGQIHLTFFNDKPFVVMRDSEYKLRMTVMKFSGTKWEIYGTRGFTNYNSLKGDLMHWKGSLYFTTNINYKGKSQLIVLKSKDF